MVKILSVGVGMSAAAASAGTVTTTGALTLGGDLFSRYAEFAQEDGHAQPDPACFTDVGINTVLTCWDVSVPGHGTADGTRLPRPAERCLAMTGQRPDDGAAARKLGDALRSLQQQSGRTLRSLETQVRISDSSLSRYFQGITVPPWAVVAQLCHVLGADPVRYRTLWEAADRSQPAFSDRTPLVAAPQSSGASSATAPEPAGTASPLPEPKPTPAPAPAGSGVSWVRKAAAWMRSRWAFALAGVLVGGVVGSLLTTLLVAVPGPAPAQRASGAAAWGPGNRPGRSDLVQPFINRATGRCLDHSLDHGLRTFACNGLSYQRWTVQALPDGTHHLRNHATGACLHDQGTKVRTGACDTTTSGKWNVRTSADESASLSNEATGACLEDSTSGLRAAPCDDTDRHKWG
ncbi:helix-turn-helix domain-containing protein [Streptomyces bobili]|uniref:helix-turn-helix domain-containing protein n=1 Tax=Streptomyces bobili TaxID=67280 RepID=UPI0033BEF700